MLIARMSNANGNSGTVISMTNDADTVDVLPALSVDFAKKV